MTPSVVVRPQVDPSMPFVRMPRWRIAPLVLVGLVVLASDLALILGDGVLTRLLGAIIALLVLTGLAMLFVMFEWPRRRRLTVAQHDGALVVPPIPALSVLARVAVLLAVLFGVPAVISLLTGQELATMFRFTAIAVAALAVVPFVRIWSGRQTQPSLRLSHDGMRLGDQALTWDEVSAVQLLERPAIKLRVVTPHRAVEIPTGNFACDPGLLRQLLAHLAADPSARTELGSPDMLERLRRGDFAD